MLQMCALNSRVSVLVLFDEKSRAIHSPQFLHRITACTAYFFHFLPHVQPYDLKHEELYFYQTLNGQVCFQWSTRFPHCYFRNTILIDSAKFEFLKTLQKSCWFRGVKACPSALPAPPLKIEKNDKSLEILRIFDIFCPPLFFSATPLCWFVPDSQNSL